MSKLAFPSLGLALKSTPAAPFTCSSFNPECQIRQPFDPLLWCFSPDHYCRGFRSRRCHVPLSIFFTPKLLANLSIPPSIDSFRTQIVNHAVKSFELVFHKLFEPFDHAAESFARLFTVSNCQQAFTYAVADAFETSIQLILFDAASKLATDPLATKIGAASSRRQWPDCRRSFEEVEYTQLSA